MYDIAEIIQERLKDAPPGLYYIPNCDVRLLLLEIDKLRAVMGRSADGRLPFTPERPEERPVRWMEETDVGGWEGHFGDSGDFDIRRQCTMKERPPGSG